MKNSTDAILKRFIQPLRKTAKAFVFCMTVVTPLHALEDAHTHSSGTTFLSQNSLSINGTQTSYTVVSEETVLPANHGLPAARYFSFGYHKKNVPEPKNRPITFLLNGGPGSASHWLHLGGFSPQRISVNSSGGTHTISNPESLLGVSDLVFIDPIGTGFSKPQTASPTATTKFWGVVKDAKSVTDFIVTWLKQHDRVNSPLYILGESYGGLRATLIADELKRAHQLSVDGLILLSAAQNYRNLRTPDGSVMGYVSSLPTYAATAWFHKKAEQDHPNMEAFLAKVREFSTGDYASALINGNRLPEKERRDVAKEISSFIGLDASYIYDNNLRIEPLDYLRRLQPKPQQKLSRLDSRYAGTSEGIKSGNYGLDPYASAIRQPFVQAAQAYFNNILKIPADKGNYISSARKHPYWYWNWNVWGEGNVPSGSRFINVMPNLERTLKASKKMKVMVASGYFDFATPFFSIENAFSELNEGQERITLHRYHAGHILYLDDAAREQLSSDIRNFIENP